MCSVDLKNVEQSEAVAGQGLVLAVPELGHAVLGLDLAVQELAPIVPALDHGPVLAVAEQELGTVGSESVPDLVVDSYDPDNAAAAAFGLADTDVAASALASDDAVFAGDTLVAEPARASAVPAFDSGTVAGERRLVVAGRIHDVAIGIAADAKLLHLG